MFHTACEKVISRGICSGHIKEEQKDEYIYGMNMFFNVCINIITMIIIGIISGYLWECIVFCLVYKTVRKYVGGFHFESSLHCYISSCFMYFVVIAIMAYIPFKICAVSIMVVISGITMWFISPVESVNKPLDEDEKRVFKKRARVNISVVSMVYIAALFINKDISEVIAIGIILVMFFALAGRLKLMAHIEEN